MSRPPLPLEPSDLAPGLFTARLANGLKVIIREDHRGGVAICNVWVRVGSNREPEALRGWSHGIEHMLFKGTDRRGEGDFAREVAEAGGSTNAGTGYETTNYHITVPAENLPVAVDVLGDALFRSTFDPDSLDAERQVLVHENHMYDDVAFGFGVTWRWGMELAFDASPYRHPIGGRDENLLERDREEILAFWRSAYRPDNMTVVVAGDVDPAAALALVEEHFGGATADDTGVSPATGIVASPPVEPPHDQPRLRLEHGDIQKAYAKLIFPAPGDDTGLAPAASVTRRILGDGRSCRLYRQLQEELKLVDNFSLSIESGRREGVVVVDLETDPARLAPAIAATARILGELTADGGTGEELSRARTRVVRSFEFGRETVQGQAGTLGQYDALGDLEGAFHFPARVAGVTPGDVRDYCGSVFRLGGLAAVIYLPEAAAPDEHGIPTDPDALRSLVTGGLPDPAGRAWPTAVTTRPARSTRTATPAAAAASAFETITLPGGIELSCRVDRAVPVAALSFCLRGGATAETAADAGLGALTQLVQVKGAGGLDAETLHATLEGQGAALSPLADRDYGGLVLTGLADRVDEGLDLTLAVILDPAFAESEVEQEKRLALEQLAAMADSPFQAASLRLRRLMYGDHPYGRPLPGTEESLPGLGRDMLTRRHRDLWTRRGLQVVASGDIDPEHLAARLEEGLKSLPEGELRAAPAVGPARIPDGIRTDHISRKQNQTVVLCAWPGPRSPEEERVPLMLMRELLNGQSGRLFEQLRNRRSLCYNTGVLGTAGFGQGMLVGYVLTAPESAEQAREALVAELAGMTAGPVGTAEFERARTQLLGNLRISSQSSGARVGRTLRDRVYGRGANDLDRLVAAIGACTPADVVRAAATFIDPEHRFDVSLGP